MKLYASLIQKTGKVPLPRWGDLSRDTGPHQSRCGDRSRDGSSRAYNNDVPGEIEDNHPVDLTIDDVPDDIQEIRLVSLLYIEVLGGYQRHAEDAEPNWQGHLPH